MNPCELITFVTALACSITTCCTDDEVTLMAAVFNQLGDTLATYETQKSLIEDCDKKNESAGNKSKD